MTDLEKHLIELLAKQRPESASERFARMVRDLAPTEQPVRRATA